MEAVAFLCDVVVAAVVVVVVVVVTQPVYHRAGLCACVTMLD